MIAFRRVILYLCFFNCQTNCFSSVMHFKSINLINSNLAINRAHVWWKTRNAENGQQTDNLEDSNYSFFWEEKKINKKAYSAFLKEAIGYILRGNSTSQSKWRQKDSSISHRLMLMYPVICKQTYLKGLKTCTTRKISCISMCMAW